MSRPFEAKYAGRCGLCDGEIVTGSRVAYMDDELVHSGKCPADHSRAEFICPRCQIVMPATGVCDLCA